MNTEMGELLIGAYLKVIEGCDVVCYNQRPPGGGLKGLHELDVLGLHFGKRTAFLCEVTTHTGGLLYVNNPTTVKPCCSEAPTPESLCGSPTQGVSKSPLPVLVSRGAQGLPYDPVSSD